MGNVPVGGNGSQCDCNFSVMFSHLDVIASVAIGSSHVQLPELHVNGGMDHGLEESLLNKEL